MYLRPSTVSEACEALAHGPAVILSGGTDVFPGLCGRPAPSRVVDLSGVSGLHGISTDDGDVRIGARTTWSELVCAPLPACFDALKAAAREIGSVQIQNVATIAGNLCNASPAADGVPPLLILDAEIEIAGATGSRRLPLSRFLIGNRRTALGAGEIVTAIVVPRPPQAGRSAFVKLGSRRYMVISIAMVAAHVALDTAGRVAEARVAVGSCSAVAQRLPALEAALAGAPAQDLGGRITAAHLAPLSPIADVRGSAEYRMDAARELIARALDGCVRDLPR